MKRFVISTNHTTSVQDQAFFKILKERWPYFGWWHQLSETWLLVDPQGTTTVLEVRDAAQQAFPGIHLLVIEMPKGGTWAGFGPTDSMFSWIKGTWNDASE